MKTFKFIVTGSLIASVEAGNEEEAFESLKRHLMENSPVSNWEIYSEGEGVRNSQDIVLTSSKE